MEQTNHPLIHPTAIVEIGAKIADNVAIGPFAVVGKDVTIASGTIIDSHVCIYGKTTIGENNHIFSHTTLGSVPQDLKYKGEKSELIIGDNNNIREFCLINIGTELGGNRTVIGDDNLIMSHSHIAHDCLIANGCIFASSSIIGGHVEIDDFAVIGGDCAIHQFVHIGRNSMLAGGSILTQDLPPFCLAQGNRANIVSVNIVGIRRHLSSDTDVIKRAFKELFRGQKKENLKERAQHLLSMTDNEYIKSLCEFVIHSQRGIPMSSDFLSQKDNIPGKENT